MRVLKVKIPEIFDDDDDPGEIIDYEDLQR